MVPISVMRRAFAALTIVTLGITGTASAAGDRGRTVRGAIELPSIRGESGFHAARCAWLTRGSESQGQLGRLIRLTNPYGNTTFRLRSLGQPLEGAGRTLSAPKLDVAFYDRLGTCDEVVQPLGVGYGYRGTASGWIPFGARYALVIYAGLEVRPPGTVCGYAFCIGRGGPEANLSSDPGPRSFRFRTASLRAIGAAR